MGFHSGGAWLFAGRKSAGQFSWLLVVSFYAVFANLPFWAASYFLHIERAGWFSLEYVALGVLALFVPRLISAGLLLVMILADTVCGVSHTYYLAPSECLKNLGFLRDLPGNRLFSLFALLALTLLVTAAAAVLPIDKIRGRQRVGTAACLIAFAASLMVVDFSMIYRQTGHVPNPFQGQNGGDSSYVKRAWAFFHANHLLFLGDSVDVNYFKRAQLCRFPLAQMLRNQIQHDQLSAMVHAAKENDRTISSAVDAAERSTGLLSVSRDQELPNMVVILVESWGLASDSSIRDGLIHPYLDPELTARYEVEQSSVPFYGPTLGGEGRELCDSDIGFHLMDASQTELQDCLPHRLAGLGYHTIALHGMKGTMFNRSTWYDTIGFQEKWFADGFRRMGYVDCFGAFTGTCDADIAKWMEGRLTRKEASPDFIYWVTLNSHFPVPTPPQLDNPAPCSISPVLSGQSAACSWYQLIANVHRSVSRLAMSNLARPTVFAIVGDHAPPFGERALRDQFSDTLVPYVLLIPRHGNPVSSQLQAQKSSPNGLPIVEHPLKADGAQ